MTQKTKILISILSVGIVLIGAWWIWNLHQKEIEINCKKLDPQYCERDEDCICKPEGCFLGGKLYWESCIDKSIICLDLCPQSCECIDNRCSCTNMPHAFRN